MLVKLNMLLYLMLNVLLNRLVKLPMTFRLNFSFSVFSCTGTEQTVSK